MIAENKTFFLAVAGMTLASIGLWLNAIDPGVWEKVFMYSMGAYAARTIADKAFVKKK